MNDNNTKFVEWIICYASFCLSLIFFKSGITTNDEIKTIISIMIGCAAIVYLAIIIIKSIISIVIMNIDVRVLALIKLLNKHTNIMIHSEEYHNFVSDTINGLEENEE